MKRSILFFLACFVACFGRISTAQNLSWSATQGPYSTTVNVFDTVGNTIYAGTKAGLYKSTNSGNIWSSVPSVPGIVFDIAHAGANIYLGGAGGITVSTDAGLTWAVSNVGLPLFPLVSAIKDFHDTLYACMGGQGFFRSTDGGTHWAQPNSSLSNKTINTMIATGTALILAEGAGINRSTNNGFSWNEPNGVIANQAIHSFAIKDKQIFAGTEAGVFRSTDDGATWDVSGTGMNADDIVASLLVSGDDKLIFAGTRDANSEVGIYRSSDNGSSWQLINNGLSSLSIYSLFTTGTEIFAGTALGISRSDNNGDSWQTISGGLPKPAITSLGEIYSVVFAGTYGSYLFGTGDAGNHWQQHSKGLTRKNVNAIVTSGTSIFAGTDAAPKQGLGGVHRSTDYGNTWTQLANGVPIMMIASLSRMGSRVSCWGDSGNFSSTDNGDTWNKGTTLQAKIIYSNDSSEYISTKPGNQIWQFSTKSGWNMREYTGPLVQAITEGGIHLFLGTDSGVYRDSSLAWVLVTGDSLNVRCLWSNDFLIATGTTKGIYLSSNNGASWQFQQSAGTDTVNAFSFGYRNLYAGTSSGVIEAPLGTFGVKASDQANALSLKVTNPSTDLVFIRFKIEKAGVVTLVAFDPLGRECARIVEGERSAGDYTLEWNTSSLASGTYLLRLLSAGSQATAKVNLVR